MARVAHAGGLLVIEVEDAWIAVRSVAGVAVDALCSIRALQLPAGQKQVPVPIFRIAKLSQGRIIRHIPLLGHLRVTFLTVPVSDRMVERCRLSGCPGVPFERVSRTHNFSRNSPDDPLSGVTIDATSLLGSVIGSQVNSLCCGGTLQIGGLRLRMA